MKHSTFLRSLHRALCGTPAMSSVAPRVLSIQSHVVHGYVGNKSATFPLQVLGFEVDAVNTVQFSNHTGYGIFTGQSITEENLEELMEGLKKNDIDHYTHLLTGYARSSTLLTKIVSILEHIRSKNPDLIYVCDPVMGDDGQIYVPAEVLSVYRDKVIPLADIITPNQFEVELLTDTKLSTIDHALAAFDKLHERGCKTIVMTSSNLGSADYLLCLSSTIKGGKKETLKISFPRYNATFTGTGDLFAALLLAWMWKLNNLKDALEHTIATIQSVLKRTLSSIAGDSDASSSAARELKLIQSKEYIEKPVITVRAEIIHARSS